jgi:hypothetical protein
MFETIALPEAWNVSAALLEPTILATNCLMRASDAAFAVYNQRCEPHDTATDFVVIGVRRVV